MNKPPDTFTAVDAETLRRFVTTVFERANVPSDQAAFLADLLVKNDLRGVFSHGTQQTAHYAPDFKNGQTNPAPQIEIVSETPTTLVVDGNGGLGYFPSHLATTRLVAKAQEMGIAAATTRNHGHFGAAGIYARIPLEHGLFCYVTSGHQLHLAPGHSMISAAGGSPMAFGLPTGEEPPFVLDFGAIHDLYHPDILEKLVEIAPSTVFRSFGMGCVCQALGGFLCGVPLDPERAQRQWPGANQGSFVIVVDVSRFFPLDQFRREMDEYARKVRQLTPLPGYDQALLAGELEWERERRFAAEGIPVGTRHAERLRRVAAEFDVPSPV